jgi:hypothetical protein
MAGEKRGVAVDAVASLHTIWQHQNCKPEERHHRKEKRPKGYVAESQRIFEFEQGTHTMYTQPLPVNRAEPGRACGRVHTALGAE